jgi:hypothetical protein
LLSHFWYRWESSVLFAPYMILPGKNMFLTPV